MFFVPELSQKYKKKELQAGRRGGLTGGVSAWLSYADGDREAQLC